MIQRKCGYRLTEKLNYTQMNIVEQPNQLLLSTVIQKASHCMIVTWHLTLITWLFNRLMEKAKHREQAVSRASAQVTDQVLCIRETLGRAL